MAKNKRKTKSIPKAQSQSRSPRFLIPGALLVAVLIGLATWFFLQKPAPVSFAAQHKGGPRLLVDKELIDLGPVRFERMVDARFRLRNVGDQPLRLAANPQVEAIEGC